MKRIILSLFVIFTVAGVKAQFTLSPAIGNVSASPAEFELVNKAYVKNTGAVADSFVWKMYKTIMPTGWDAALCDKNLCYGADVWTSVFYLAPGDSGNLDVHAYPNGNSGNASVDITVYAMSDSSVKKSGTYNFNTWAQSVRNTAQRSEFEFYPNPATNKLNINLDSDKPVTIEVFNVLGQLKIEHIHTGKTSVMDLSSLPTGIYFLRYINSNGQTISKQFKKI